MVIDFLGTNHQICSSWEPGSKQTRGDGSSRSDMGVDVCSAFLNGTLGTGCFSGVQGRLAKYLEEGCVEH